MTTAAKTTAAKKSAAKPAAKKTTAPTSAAAKKSAEPTPASGSAADGDEQQNVRGLTKGSGEDRVDADGYPVGDHVGGTGPQDAAAQIRENVEGHGDSPATGVTTGNASPTPAAPENVNALGNASPTDNGTVNVPGHKPVSPVAAPLERVPNPVYKPEHIEDGTQVGADADPFDASAVAPKFAVDNARLTDEHGKSVKVASIFDAADEGSEFQTVNARTFMEKPMPGTDATTRTLMFPKGAKVHVKTVATLIKQWD